MHKKYMLVNEETGKEQYINNEERAMEIQNEKALEGVDLVLYRYDESINQYVLD